MSGINAKPMPTFDLQLESGGDYEDVVRWTGGNFPPGSEVELIIGTKLNTVDGLAAATIYDFVISGDAATIKVESEVCGLWPVPQGEWRLRYRNTTTTPTTEKIVAGGKIKRS